MASFNMARYQVKVIKEGALSEKAGTNMGCTGITLVLDTKGTNNLIVGTGSPGDTACLLKGLATHNVNAENIEYVVCPYGHPETVGNLNLFPSATHIVGYNIMKGDSHIVHDFEDEYPYEIDEDLEVVATPGLYPQVVSVIVRDSPLGCVAIAGGCFHVEADIETPEIWVEVSRDSDCQNESRCTILKEAAYIVPRYGNIFRVPDCYRMAEVGIAMTPDAI